MEPLFGYDHWLGLLQIFTIVTMITIIVVFVVAWRRYPRHPVLLMGIVTGMYIYSQVIPFGSVFAGETYQFPFIGKP